MKKWCENMTNCAFPVLELDLPETNELDQVI